MPVPSRGRQKGAYADIRPRFEGRYIPEPNTGCWLWEGATSQRGYGIIVCYGKKRYAHRTAYELYKGKIPEGLVVRHQCDTPLCVNPDHLLVGTQAENVKDRDRRGRGADTRGEKHGCAKLTESDVLLIRKDPRPHRDIAENYGVSKTAVRDVKRRKTWAHI